MLNFFHLGQMGDFLPKLSGHYVHNTYGGKSVCILCYFEDKQ